MSGDSPFLPLLIFRGPWEAKGAVLTRCACLYLSHRSKYCSEKAMARHSSPLA